MEDEKRIVKAPKQGNADHSPAGPKESPEKEGFSTVKKVELKQALKEAEAANRKESKERNQKLAERRSPRSKLGANEFEKQAQPRNLNYL